MGAGGVAEEVDSDAVFGDGVLVEGVDDDGALVEEVEDGVERAALGEGAEAGAAEAPFDELVEEFGFEGASDEVEDAFVLGELADTGDRGDFEITVVAGEEDDAFALVVGVDGGLDILDTDPGLAFGLGHEG